MALITEAQLNMANLNEEPVWEEGVYQFETTDPVEGGPEGIDNKPTRQLANRTAYLKQEQEKLKDKFDVEKTPNPLPQYLTRDDFIKHMLFKGMPISAVGPEPDPDIWLPAGRVELLRADYPTVFKIVSASAFFTDQATIDANPRLYAGHWGTGDGATTFTSDDWSLMMNIKVAGGYGASGSTKEDHIQNITGQFSTHGDESGSTIRAESGVFYSNLNFPNAYRLSSSLQQGSRSTGPLRFDASLVARTDTYTDSMGLFLDYYRVIPKGVFSYA
ncbi:hypothetical protein [Vibrio mimicus]|uniref:hypothetical protein n=1 Tax=Vibrio mimicus TaxID=674 RepID=UPI002FF162AF